MIGIGKVGDLDRNATLVDLQIYALRRGYRYEDPRNERRFVVADPNTGAGWWEGGILERVENLEEARREANRLEVEQLLENFRLEFGDSPSSPYTPDAARAASGSSEEAPPAQREDDEATHTPRPDSLTHAGPGIERAIWQGRNFRDRGYTLEHLYNNRIIDAIKAQGDNRALYDVETDTHVKQIKSTTGSNPNTTRSVVSKATRDAGRAVRRNPTGTMTGKSPQAVIITPTDAPASTSSDISAGYNRIRRPVPNSSPPEHVRGLPGRVGTIGRGLTFGGIALSGASLVYDIANEDYTMAVGDAISTIGGGLEIYAIATESATVAGVSAMSAGLALGGVGIAVTSGISGYRSYQRGDYAGAVAGAVGVAAGIAITAGVIFSAPALLIGGLIGAAAVGLFHLGRWLLE